MLPATAASAATGGAGAPTPYTHVEAEASAHNGAAIGPSYEYNTLEAEASGRRAVTIDATGEYVEFTVPAAANSMVVRLSIPDSATGAEYTAPLSLYVDGARQDDVITTNKFSHLYGGYQFSNTPQGNHHWYFDEYQRLLPQMPAGTKVRLQKDANSTASSYTVDFMEFEQVAGPLPQPTGSVSVTSHGADPTGLAESTQAFKAAIAAAGPGGTVWIPAGRFRVNGHTVVDNVTIRGAGMWHSIVTGTDPGFYGRWRSEGGSSDVNLSHFQISGNVVERCDSCQVNGIGGAMSSSNINNIWIEHTKVGMWMDGPMDRLVFDRMRVRNQTADGVNFHQGVTNSVVSNSHFRNTADDAMAMWSEQTANADNVFDNNTVEQTVWANGIAIYGGRDISVTDNLVIDSGISQGGGIHVANRFASTPLAGATNVLRNTIVRSGGLDPNWQFGVGSLWFDARDGAMTGRIVVDDLIIRHAPLEAIHFVSGSSISNVHVSDVDIDAVGTFVVQAQVAGSATFTNVQATRIGQAQAPVYNCNQFGMTDGGGNGAWFTAPRYTACGQWPAPTTWPADAGVTVAPTALNFGPQSTGSTSAAQAVTVKNGGQSALAVAAASITGPFAQSSTCPASLAAGARCTVSVTFKPTAAGATAGQLSVGGTNIALSGTGVAPGPVLTADPAQLTFAGTSVGATSASQTVTLRNSGTSAATVSEVTASGDFTQTNACRTIAAGASCTVTVAFKPAAEDRRTGTLTITSDANNSPTRVALAGTGIGTSTNVARGRTATATSSVNTAQAPAAATDGDPATYWESAQNAFPQSLTVDLGSTVGVGRVVLTLPPLAAWATRTQTMSLEGSADGTTFSTLVPSAGRTFTSPSNTVTIPLPTGTSTRHVRVRVTGNTGWPAAQVSEIEVYGSAATGDTTAPSIPTRLTGSTSGTTVTLSWSASTDEPSGSGLAGYDVYADGVLLEDVAGTTATDTRDASARVEYTVRARDKAGNRSAASAPFLRVCQTACDGGGTPTDRAAGKPVTATSSVHTFVAANATDGNLATYWEGAGFPASLTVAMGAPVSVRSVVVRLNPDRAWGTRTQRIEVVGRGQASEAFAQLAPPTVHTFAAGVNSVTIPVSGTAADLRLITTANSGAPGPQVAELQVMGAPAPGPDLTVTAVSATQPDLSEANPVTISATVKNAGNASSTATNVNLYLNTVKVGTAPVGALEAGASATVSAEVGARPAGSYALSAKVDEPSTVLEQDETNNTGTGDPLTVRAVQSADLVVTSSWSAGTPAAGSPVTFAAAISNQGNLASSSGSHAVTALVKNEAGATVATLNGSHLGVIAPGQTATVAITPTWTAADGRFAVTTTVATDPAELTAKQANNTTTQSFFIGRGANMPYEILEAESAAVGGGARVVGNADGRSRAIGDLAGEASGRRAVQLDATGEHVEFTTTASTNTLVTRFSIPDNAAGTGLDATINVYVNGTFHKAFPLTSRFAWLYGNETSPTNAPGPGPRHIYDEANIFLDGTFPAGTKIRLQKDSANTAASYGIDFVSTEQVAPNPNPDAARYVTPAGFSHQDVQAALDKVRMDTTGALVGVYLPTGTYSTANKFQVYGKAVQVVGAGPWYTRFVVDPSQTNTDAGFRAEQSATGSRFTGFGFFGNYTSRIDGPGKVFDFINTSRMTIDNIWTEHMICMFWGANTDFMDISSSRIRNTFADGINMTNGSTNNHLHDIEARSTGDDSFALFSAIDAGGGDVKGNVYENLTALTPWRAAGLAVYGGYDNTFRNIHVADTLTYSAVTISSLDFGYPMNGFGATPPTVLENMSLVRSGGQFWGNQVFPAIWAFSASKAFRGIRVDDVDIVDPTFHGVMFQTNYVGGQPQNPVTDTVFTNLSVSGARTVPGFEGRSGMAIWCNPAPETGQGPAVGEATFRDLALSDNDRDVVNTCPGFTITRVP
ncbi:hypothetical protein FHR80_000232 [Cellulomonas cellasea]|uniref:F5/8 type C domain-containing protein n=1 Tax=Cellulomonas cellasea TaxID=43670 RepID=A0A7W4Y996_9CELL|nr:hypothetical protein [Cellulomonas cellasea]